MTVGTMMNGGLSQLAAQSVAGEYTALVAAGTTAADAASVKNEIHTITGDNNSGVILPVSTIGDQFWLGNISGNTIIVYPPTGGTVNNTTSVSVGNGKTATCKAYSNNDYLVSVGA